MKRERMRRQGGGREEEKNEARMFIRKQKEREKTTGNQLAGKTKASQKAR